MERLVEAATALAVAAVLTAVIVAEQHSEARLAVLCDGCEIIIDEPLVVKHVGCCVEVWVGGVRAAVYADAYMYTDGGWAKIPRNGTAILGGARITALNGVAYIVPTT